MKDVVGFGALNVDFIYKIAALENLETRHRRLKPGGEIYAPLEEFESTLKKLAKIGTLTSKSGGGQAANTIYALSKMGFSTGLVGKVGDDPNGDFLIRTLELVDSSRIIRSGVSGVCLAILDKSRDRSNIIFPNTNDTLVFDQLDLDFMLGAKYIYLTSFVGNSPLQAQLELIKRISSPVKLGFDPGEIYARLGMEQLLPIIEKCHTLFITDEEIRILTGKEYKTGAAFLLSLGPSAVVCKMGTSGCYVLSHQTEFQIPALGAKVVDRTGAGDVFAAGFIAGQLEGRSLYNSAVFATEAASRSITEYGRARYPDRRFLQKQLK